MLTSVRFVLAVLPVFALAQSSPQYTLTINGVATVIGLPPLPTDSATTITSTAVSAVSTVISTVSPASGGVAGPAPSQTSVGQTIPITVNGYITYIVLPYFPDQSTPTGLVTVTSEAAAQVTSAAGSISSSAQSVASSAAGAASSQIAAASSVVASAVSSAQSQASAGTYLRCGPVISRLNANVLF